LSFCPHLVIYTQIDQKIDMTAPTLSHLSLSLGYALLTIQIFQVSRFILS